MADEPLLGASLQESILTLMCFDGEHGAVATGVLKPDYFDDFYKPLAERLIAYRLKHRVPPGAAHIDDVFDTLLDPKKNKLSDSYRRTLQGLLQQHQDGLNAVYVTDRLTTFAREQILKAGIMRAAKVYEAGGEGTAVEAENILYAALREHATAFQPGTRLADTVKSLAFLNSEPECVRTGIPELDRYNLGPARKELHLMLAPPGRGKSWWLAQLGKQALLVNRWRVLHVSLEMSEERSAARYFQTFFAVAKRDEAFERAEFAYNSLEQLSGIEKVIERPELHFNSPKIGPTLRAKMNAWGLQMDRLVIKAFPSGRLTMAQFRAYLDALEQHEKFVPDLILFDYPDLCEIDMRNPRLSMGRILVDLRGIAGERNIAMAAVKQVNRAGAQVGNVRAFHAAEDWSAIMTADIALTYSQTEQEHPIGVARIFVDKGRNERDKFTILISQAYTTGQFVLQSALEQSNYSELLDKAVPPQRQGPDHNDEDED